MRISVVGLGLIGGSLLRQISITDGSDTEGSDTHYDVTGYDKDPAVRDLARAAGLTVTDDPYPDAVDLVVLAAPLPAVPALLDDLPPGATITDVGSVKQPVLDAVRRRGHADRFVGGHPMAGTAQSGFAAADPRLFTGAAWVLCLEADTDLDRWLQVAGLVTAVGARVVPIDAAEHDAAVARISHLPHLMAAALAVTAADPLAAALAAGSYRDGTRVAGTRPELTAAMCEANAPALRVAVAEAVARFDGDWTELFRAGYAARTAWPPAPGPAGILLRDADLAAGLTALGRAGGHVLAVHGDRLDTSLPPARPTA